MIARGVDGLAVVPMSPEAFEPVLARAMGAGIIMITHEAASQQNMYFDIEAFMNEDFGANLMEQLDQCMGGKGAYAVFVGAQTHMDWINGAVADQVANYPGMTLVDDRNETADDQQQACTRAQEVLRAFPNVRGVKPRRRPMSQVTARYWKSMGCA